MIIPNYSKPRIVNIVATGSFPNELDLEKLYNSLDIEKSYEPEVYPALLVKVGKERYHITLYKNGKYIITGVSSVQELAIAYNNIYKKLKSQRCFSRSKRRLKSHE